MARLRVANPWTGEILRWFDSTRFRITPVAYEGDGVRALVPGAVRKDCLTFPVLMQGRVAEMGGTPWVGNPMCN